ncbi:hypothetical protein J5N97_006107 [Dioscorea zingiberensis]|uniref:Putative zinc-finger domain-containing protein n=1 Tax=Dioscorea zingiberensis TaxID=325984 RepID=A0A9D5HTE1_9LILI|nr:hypothetical protein J5N97_006107 [Dioscorea zingiberensis]
METKIDELRAKAIASLPNSNPKPSPPPQPKSPETREEGELSHSDEAVTTCFTAPPEKKTSTEPDPGPVSGASTKSSKISMPKFKKAINQHHTCHSVMTNTQLLQKSVVQNHNQFSKKRKATFKSNSNQNLGWPGKGSNDNLVIRFSDDDSESGSEECQHGKTLGGKVDLTRSKISSTSLQLKPEGLQHAINNRPKQVWKKESACMPSNSANFKKLGAKDKCPGASSVEKESNIQGSSYISKGSTGRETDTQRSANLADHQLASLRHQIAVRENELRVQQENELRIRQRAAFQSKEMVSGLYSAQHRPDFVKGDAQIAGINVLASANTIGLAPKEQTLKRAKLDENAHSKLSSGDQVQGQVPFGKSSDDLQHHESDGERLMGTKDTSMQHQEVNVHVPVSSESLHNVLKDNKSLGPTHETLSSAVGNLGMPLQLQNNSKFSSGISFSHSQSHDRTLQMDSNTLTKKLPVDQMMSSFESLPILRQFNISRKKDASPFLDDPTNTHDLEGSQQTIPKVGIGMPSSTSTNTLDKYLSVPVGKLLAAETTILREGNANLQTLRELEELHDKELEEAQELRRRCEVEERRALIAYREAQRALMDANEKCTLLYRKRELFSCQARTLMMEASSSIWPSSWRSSGGTVMDLSKTAPSAIFDLPPHVGHEMPANHRTVCQLGYESSIHCPDGSLVDLSCNPINICNYGSEQCHEPNRGSSEHKDNIGFTGERATNSNEESFPCDHSISEGTHTDKHVEKPFNEKAHDFELEASLRSQLVARLGKRSSTCKNSDGSKTDIFDKEAISTDEFKKPYSPSMLQSLEGEKKKMTSFQGIEKPRSSIDQSSSQANGPPHYTVDDPHKMSNPGDCGSFSKESCWQMCIPVLSLPSSVLHIVSRHVKLLFSESGHGFHEKDIMLNISPRVIVEYEPGQKVSSRLYNERCRGKIEKDSHSGDLAIDFFWPFCMFELRGRCNDEECPWQHFRNLKQTKNSLASGLDSQACHSPCLGKSASFGSHYSLDQNHLQIPTYQIGVYLMKAGLHLSQSILARCTWQYWQRGFSTSSILPLSIQRTLPPDAPCLESDDSRVADDHKRNMPAFHFQCPDGMLMQAMQGLTDAEQSLELALDLFNGTFYRPDPKQALSLLSRAIEAYPNSVILWVIYLHIFYSGETYKRNDDIFPYAVEHNKQSYELWLMYINSRMQLSNRLDAYVSALNALCDEVNACDKGRRYISACILDIFLQMVDFLQMSDNVDWVLERIYELVRPNSNSNDKLLSDIYSQLIVSDRCIFWFCCVHLTIYKRLPEAIVQQFEFEKDLPFEYEWPCAQVANDEKDQALEIMRFAVDKVILDHEDNSYEKDPVDLRPLHFLVVCHLRCKAALEGLQSVADLLPKYMKMHPTCIELILMSARLQESCTVGLQRFEEILSNWPKEMPGVQCVWNQYVEYILKDGRIEFAQKVMDQWYQNFSCIKLDTETGNIVEKKDDAVELPSYVNISTSTDDIFSVLNLYLYKVLHKDYIQASAAINKALKLANFEDFRHCVREHAAFISIDKSKDVKDVPSVLVGLIKGYLGDCRFSVALQPLSRRFYQNIKKPRIRQLVNGILGPASMSHSLVNSVLEACYGPMLLPKHFGKPKDLVDFVEPLMEVAPSNYLLALSVYKLTSKTFNFTGIASDAVMFWATTLLVNSIFQAVPAAPEHIWLEVANVLKDFEVKNITQWFHELAISVYPFSVRLWQSYLDISKKTGNADLTVKMARERGIELR